MKIHTCEQRSEEWFRLRLGKVTGTRFKDLMTARPPGFETLCRKIAAERITGQSADQPFRISEAMQRGIDRENGARAAFEMEIFQRFKEVGFIEKDDLFGVSPDGICEKPGNNIGLELKCPLPSTHLGYLIEPFSLFKAYQWQVLGSLWCSGFDNWIIASYCLEFGEQRFVWFNASLSDPYREEIETKADLLKKRVNEILEAVDK